MSAQRFQLTPYTLRLKLLHAHAARISTPAAADQLLLFAIAINIVIPMHMHAHFNLSYL